MRIYLVNLGFFFLFSFFRNKKLTDSTFLVFCIILNIITQGTFCIASWRGTEVAVKTLGKEVFTDEDKVWVSFYKQYFSF